MAECKTDAWTLREIHDSLVKGYNGKKKIVIPMFQRGQRWSPNKEKDFKDSLTKNFPIGTLLFYKTTKNDQEIYTLIDGLQRATAIKRYISSPTKYFTLNDITDIDKNALEDLYQIAVTPSGNQSFQRKLVNETILNYVKNLSTYDDFELMQLFLELKKDFLIINTYMQRFTDIFQPIFKTIKENFNNLCNMKIPAIVYTGPVETLPVIFERINSKGVPLNPYEIYAASWNPTTKFKVNNDEIIRFVIDKYNKLNDSEYDLSDYDPIKIRNDKMLNSFEYIFGYSKYIATKYETLAFNLKLKADETNPIGFLLLNACFNNSKKEIETLYINILKYKDMLNKLEKCLDDCIVFVEDCIKKITYFKGNSRKNKAKIFHAQTAILSLISYTFRVKYDEDLNINSDWRQKKNILEENYWKYYVFDILTKFWNDGGEKLHICNNNNRYLKSISVGQFSTAFDQYSETAKLRKEKTNIASTSNDEYVILNTIYLKHFTAFQQLGTEHYDVEHIATKNQMISFISNTASDGLPISHIANLCYLPEQANRSKKEKNFYQDNKYLAKTHLTINDIENNYSFTKAEDLEWMDLNFGQSDATLLSEYYFEYLDKRSKNIKKMFLESLGYQNVNLSTVDNIYNFGNFDKTFFRNEKICSLVKKCFIYMLEQDRISSDDLYNLRDTNYSMTNLCVPYPVFEDEKDNIYDEEGNAKYWSTPLEYQGRKIFLCNQFKEADRPTIITWLINHMN